MEENVKRVEMVIEPQRVLHVEAIAADHGRPEFIIAHATMGISGFFMGLFVGWMVWG